MARKATVRHSASQWQAIIANQSSSNLTIKNYCSQNDITISSFYHWREKLTKSNSVEKRRYNNTNRKDADWIEVPLPKESNAKISWDIELDLPGGIVLRMKALA